MFVPSSLPHQLSAKVLTLQEQASSGEVVETDAGGTAAGTTADKSSEQLWEVIR